jgi:D-threonate/D-erythronate kinase
MIMKIAVIADDLTGANATGVRLAKYGFSTKTPGRDIRRH